jgi:hypothetical protein
MAMRTGTVVEVIGGNFVIALDGGGKHTVHISDVETTPEDVAPRNWRGASIGCGFTLREGDRVVIDRSSTRPVRLVTE